jgi:hypothetical protein
MSQTRYSFVLWAIPRFHRSGPARVATPTTNGEIAAPERSLADLDQVKPTTDPGGKVGLRSRAWRYAFS